MILLGAAAAAYLIGAFPAGVLVSRVLKGIDPRQHGSGNVGATNVYRVVGKLPGLAVLIVDTAKGWLPPALLAPAAVRLSGGASPDGPALVFGVLAVAGHIWNPFLSFRGGKGVATALGVFLALDLRLGAAALAVWISVLLLSRYVSVASVSAATAAPFLVLLFGGPTLWVVGTIAVSLAIIARHRPNLLRLLHGEEPKITSKRSQAGS